jgi:gamma-glutamylcyclotransferase (GGCT)/AIG2-like uncharacterized protein YtfP
MAALKVFVYGTLKRGLRNHAAHCRHVADIIPASLVGRLYEPAHRRFPMLAVPESTILARGSDDALADAALLDRLAPVANDPPPGFVVIRGELLVFEHAIAESLAGLDTLEGFDPRGHSHYERVAVPLVAPTEHPAAWVYIIPPGESTDRLIDLGGCTEWVGR